jgi:hypothetical protein
MAESLGGRNSLAQRVQRWAGWFYESCRRSGCDIMRGRQGGFLESEVIPQSSFRGEQLSLIFPWRSQHSPKDVSVPDLHKALRRDEKRDGPRITVRWRKGTPLLWEWHPPAPLVRPDGYWNETCQDCCVPRALCIACSGCHGWFFSQNQETDSFEERIILNIFIGQQAISSKLQHEQPSLNFGALDPLQSIRKALWERYPIVDAHLSVFRNERFVWHRGHIPRSPPAFMDEVTPLFQQYREISLDFPRIVSA